MLLSAGSPLAVLSQLQHKDVPLALLAFKSFAQRVDVGRVFILNDGSLTSADHATLTFHLADPTFLKLSDYSSRHCPKGGCWERLLAISTLVKNYYVVQLDSDTLTIGDISEVQQCIARNESFVIGTWDRQTLETMKFRNQEAQRHLSGTQGRSHIQLAAEAAFDRLSGYEDLRYVRGCAGFTGFGKGSFEPAFVEGISGEMLEILGPRWTEWGSEQVMSNIVIANIPGSGVLPHPKFSDCMKYHSGTTAFIHFIGSCRFRGSLYAMHARKVVAGLL
ncbi:MAG: hypothetical protein HYX63_00780 [Gammaproteobacteria bacterium]|nr:hypothetical protein [Gammaproteobacteria bacterium]